MVGDQIARYVGDDLHRQINNASEDRQVAEGGSVGTHGKFL